jgi:hypothetical protein
MVIQGHKSPYWLAKCRGYVRFSAQKADSVSSPSMKTKLTRPTTREAARIARGIAADSHAAPDLSQPVRGIIPRGRAAKPDRKVSVTIRLNRDRPRLAGADQRGVKEWPGTPIVAVSDMLARHRQPIRVTIVAEARLGAARAKDGDDCATAFNRIEELATRIPGYIAHKPYVAADGDRLTLAERGSPASLRAWAVHPGCVASKKLGRDRFYEECRLRVCEVVRELRFTRCAGAA